MKYVRLGTTGLKVSRICLGCMSYGDPSRWSAWVLKEPEARPFFRKAWEGGINFFDTADVYSRGASEEITGRALKELAPRDQLVIATKVNGAMGDGPNDRGLSRKHILDAIDASLRRLQTEYVDLYQIHRWDYETPIEETLEALNDVVRAGKARYIGASSMFAWQFSKALYTQQMQGWTKFSTMQNHYNLVYREEEREMLPLCRDQGIGVIPWSPLARGFLAGARHRQGEGQSVRAQSDQSRQNYYQTEAAYSIVDRVLEIAAKRGAKPAQIALAWMMSKPVISAPIVGTTKLAQLDDAIGAVEIELSAEEIKQLEEPYAPTAIAGHAYA